MPGMAWHWMSSLCTNIFSLIPRCSGVRSLQMLFSLIETQMTRPHYNWQLRMDMSSENLLKLTHISMFHFITLFSTYVISILETLKACVDGEREAIPPLWHRKLKTDWWNKVVPYFLYAASCGSLVAVKCFIASGHKPNIRYMYYAYIHKF